MFFLNICPDGFVSLWDVDIFNFRRFSHGVIAKLLNSTSKIVK